ncbi:MAG: hypothetical protein N4A44_05010 [Alphaproteobacteria bacterium]|jgi:hypothetical protein|nr:hypothetical protein [Alphaproteobacteria bacterium]
MSNNSKSAVIKNLLDVSLSGVFWVDAQGSVVTLKEVVGRRGSLDGLTIEELQGAFTALQIKHQDFSKSFEEKSELLAEVKKMVFASVKNMVAVLEEGQRRENIV